MDARQALAGAPIDITMRLSTSAGNDSTPYTYLAVSTTNTMPATFAAPTYKERANFFDDAWDSSQSGTSANWSGGTNFRSTQAQTSRVFKRLDANYAAGRYLWILGFETYEPSNSDAPVAHAGPYLIL